MHRRKSLVSTDTVCNIFLDSLNIDKNPTQHLIHLISYKCKHFQHNIIKKTFSSSKSHKGVHLNFKFQNLKISVAPLRRFLAVYTEILVPVACLRRLRSFPAPMERLRHVDVTMTLISSGVVVRGLPDRGL